MPTTIKLQGQFISEAPVLFLLFLLLISPILFKIFNKLKNKKNMPQKKVEEQVATPTVTISVRDSYVNKIEKLRKDFQSGKRSDRETFGLLSFYIKEFVLEISGIDITKKTLAEIRAINIPEIEKLIEEYYAFEFAPDKLGDVNKSIDRTVKVIKTWS